MLPLMRRYEPLFGIDGVVSDGTATIKVPGNRRILGIRIFGSATIGGSPSTTVTDMVDRVTTIVRGKEIRVESAADIAAIRTFYKLPAETGGALTLYYMEPHRADVNDETLPAWPLYNGEGDITLKLKLKTGLTSPALKAICIYDQGAFKNEAGVITKQIVKRYSVFKSLGTTGDFTNQLGTGLPLLGIFFKTDSTQTIDSCKVTVNDTDVVHELTRVENNAMLADYNLDGTAFKYCLRFDVEGQIFNRLQDIRSLNVRLGLSAAANVEAIVEEVAPDYI